MLNKHFILKVHLKISQTDVYIVNGACWCLGMYVVSSI